MVQTAQPRTGEHDGVRCRPLLDWASVRRILVRGVVDAVLMIIAGITTNQPPETLLVQRANVAEDLAATTADPALRQTIVPRRLDACSLGLKACRLKERNHFSIEFRIVVQDYVSVPWI
jgi:hypothetical protein